MHEVFGKLRNLYKSRASSWIYRAFEALIFRLPFRRYHCVSVYTLNALRLLYGIPDHKLFLAYNGVDYDFRNAKNLTLSERESVITSFNLQNKRNLLYFGHTGISKGIDLLVDAIPEILALDDEIHLIFNFIPAQREKYIVDKINMMLAQLPTLHAKRVTLSYSLPKTTLRVLVAEVQGVIAPSLSEGFGSVHTETIALGTPLITTYLASLPEVVGGKVLFFSAGDKASLLQAIKDLKAERYTPKPEKKFSRDEQYAKIAEWYHTA